MARAVLNTFSLRVSKNHRDEMLNAMITILLDVESKKTSKGIASALNMQANLGHACPLSSGAIGGYVTMVEEMGHER